MAVRGLPYCIFDFGWTSLLVAVCNNLRPSRSGRFHSVPLTTNAWRLTVQVVVHNLPWDCTWQQLKDAFADCGEIDRADVVFDSRGRSR